MRGSAPTLIQVKDCGRGRRLRIGGRIEVGLQPRSGCRLAETLPSSPEEGTFMQQIAAKHSAVLRGIGLERVAFDAP
jgi:hypothetical protein